MFNSILLLLILIILIIVLILSYKIYYNKLNLCDKDKDFIVFVIDMYVEYAEELKINSKEKHDIIVDNLNKIKIKLSNNK